jgi:hypothetical protein
MTGRMKRKTQAREVHIMWARNDGETLQTIDWSPAGLQRELVAMLMRAELAPLDLVCSHVTMPCVPTLLVRARSALRGCTVHPPLQVRAWDQSNDFSFSSREFLIMMKKIVFTTAIADDGSDAVRAAARKEALARAQKADTEGQLQWHMAKVAGKADKEAKELLSLEDIAREQAATKVQAFARGRIARRKLMSKQDADKLWYATRACHAP